MWGLNGYFLNVRFFYLEERTRALPAPAQGGRFVDLRKKFEARRDATFSRFRGAFANERGSVKGEN